MYQGYSSLRVVGRFIVAAMSPSPLSFGIQVGGEDTAATERPNCTTTFVDAQLKIGYMYESG